MSDTGILILTILTSSAVLSFAQFIITRWDNKRNISSKLDKLTKDFDEYKATLARTHILRFNDELRAGMVHSEEYFKQQILDIYTYNNYCNEHPEFANGLTVMASENIRKEFKRLYIDVEHKD